MLIHYSCLSCSPLLCQYLVSLGSTFAIWENSLRTKLTLDFTVTSARNVSHERFRLITKTADKEPTLSESLTAGVENGAVRSSRDFAVSSGMRCMCFTRDANAPPPPPRDCNVKSYSNVCDVSLVKHFKTFYQWRFIGVKFILIEGHITEMHQVFSDCLLMNPLKEDVYFPETGDRKQEIEAHPGNL